MAKTENLPALASQPDGKELALQRRVRDWFDDHLEEFLAEGLKLLQDAGKDDAPRVSIWNKMCDKLLPDRKESGAKGPGTPTLIQINNVSRGKTATDVKVIDG